MAGHGKVVWLTTRGRRTGRPRSVAIGFADEPDGSVLVAANDDSTAWARNLLERADLPSRHRRAPLQRDRRAARRRRPQPGDRGPDPALRDARREARATARRSASDRSPTSRTDGDRRHDRDDDRAGRRPRSSPASPTSTPGRRGSSPAASSASTARPTAPLIEGEHLDGRAARRRAAPGTFEAQVTALQPPTRFALHGKRRRRRDRSTSMPPSRPRTSARACAGRSASGCRCATGCSSRWRGPRSSAPPRSISRRSSAAWSRRQRTDIRPCRLAAEVDAVARRTRPILLVTTRSHQEPRPT